MFLEEAKMRRAHEASNQILKDELVKVYKKMDQERQARIQGESVMKLLTGIHKENAENTTRIENQLRQADHECNVLKAGTLPLHRGQPARRALVARLVLYILAKPPTES